MQPEGPNKSEERLQRYAKERRAQGEGFSLHPATRRLLQGEVARQFGTTKKQEPRALSWFGLWRGRFAFAGALAAMVVATTWFFLNGPAKKRDRMELATASVSRDEKNVALESDRFAFDAETPKPTGAVRPAAMRSEPADKLAPERGRVLDGIVANEFQLGAKLETSELALGLNRGDSGAVVHYFADVASVLPFATNATATPLPIAPFVESGSFSSLSPMPQTKPPPNIDAGVVAGWGANGVVAGTAIATNSVSFGNNATRFSRLDTPLPQVALRNEYDEAKRLSEITQSTKALPQVAYQNVGEPAALAAQSLNAPAAPARLPAEAAGLGDSLAKSQAGGQQLSVEARSGIENRGANLSRAEVNNSQLFYRQAAVSAEEPAARAKQLEDLADVKKSEEAAVTQVLSQFTVEQRGNTVRVMDFDGSVYDGVIDAPAAIEPEKLKENLARDKDAVARTLQEQEVRRAGEANQPGEYSFRASGSNAALRQFIVVNARFRQGTNATNTVVNQRGFGGVADTSAGGSISARAPTGPVDARRTLDRFGRASGPTNSALAIEGTVQVGPTNVQRFIAVPGARQ